MDYRSLPKLRDSLSHVYVEHARIDKESKAVAVHDKAGKTLIPVSNLTLLLIGPGSSITHEAVKVLADSGVMTTWCGEGIIRYYAHGLGETRKGYKLERQAALWADENKKMNVVRAMYFLRLGIKFNKNLTLQQLRGMEGNRVKNAYAEWSTKTGVPWYGRSYDRKNWGNSDRINRALSVANACLYGICHSAIISGGYSAGLGFIHSGKQLSFVYDIADLYKAAITIPVAFEVVKSAPKNLEREVRKTCRDAFNDIKLLKRILPDIDRILGAGEKSDSDFDDDWNEDDDPSKPLPYWTPKSQNNEEDDQW